MYKHMTEPAHPYCRCLFYTSNALARATTQVAAEAFAPTGLHPSAAYVLLTVLRDPGSGPGHVAEVMTLDRSTVTRLVEGLEKKGLVRRQARGRTVAISPTAAALALEQQLKQCGRRAYERFQKLVGPGLARLTGEAFAAAQAMEGGSSRR